MATRAVLVTTENRGVFFGYLDDVDDESPAKLTLTDGRNCIHWTDNIHGFLGLASVGPGPQCRVGPAATRFTVFGITSIADVTPAAVTKWENEPWRP